MRLTNIVRGRRVRKKHWPKDEFLKITSVGHVYICSVNQLGKEVVFPNDPDDDDWVLMYPQIPLKPLKSDLEKEYD